MSELIKYDIEVKVKLPKKYNSPEFVVSYLKDQFKYWEDIEAEVYLADDVDKRIEELKQRIKELEAIVTNIQATIDYLHYDDRKITVRQLEQLLEGGE